MLLLAHLTLFRVPTCRFVVRRWLCFVGLAACVAMAVALYGTDRLGHPDNKTDWLVNGVFLLLLCTVLLQCFSLIVSFTSAVSWVRACLPVMPPQVLMQEWYCKNYTADLLRPVPSQPVSLTVVERSTDYAVLEWGHPTAFNSRITSFEVSFLQIVYVMISFALQLPLLTVGRCSCRCWQSRC